MLQDEYATGSQYASFANGPDDFPRDRIAIGRVGEDDVHRTGMVGEVPEPPKGIRQPDPALCVRSATFRRQPSVMRAGLTRLTGLSRLARRTMRARLTGLSRLARRNRRTTESTTDQVVPDHPGGTAVAVDE